MSGPWFVLDQRESYMRGLGWTGPCDDVILITDRDAKAVQEAQGDNCIVARIRFDNRSEKLGESNLANARLIAAAPDLLAALKWAVERLDYLAQNNHESVAAARAAIAKATGAA